MSFVIEYNIQFYFYYLIKYLLKKKTNILYKKQRFIVYTYISLLCTMNCDIINE